MVEVSGLAVGASLAVAAVTAVAALGLGLPASRLGPVGSRNGALMGFPVRKNIKRQRVRSPRDLRPACSRRRIGSGSPDKRDKASPKAFSQTKSLHRKV